MRVTCILLRYAPKCIQPDQEPTPIDCHVFKERTTKLHQPASRPSPPPQQREGRIIQTFSTTSTPLKLFFRTNLRPQKTYNLLFLLRFPHHLSSERAHYTQVFRRVSLFAEIFQKEDIAVGSRRTPIAFFPNRRQLRAATLSNEKSSRSRTPQPNPSLRRAVASKTPGSPAPDSSCRRSARPARS